MSALSPERDRRGAQRLALPKPVPATLGGFPGKILEFSLIGCRFEHVDRITLRARLHLDFSWRGKTVRLMATVVRSEMNVVRRKAAYTSGLEFCESISDAPAVVRDVVAWLTKEAAKTSAAIAPEPTPANATEDEPEMLSAPYLQCTFLNGKWLRTYVDKPLQPPDGFTIAAPSDESEVDVLCRAYETAKGDGRRAMRTRFEQAIARQKR